MKLEKALEIMEIEAHLAARQPETGIYDALKLLIEAGKYVYSQYDPDHQMMRKLLPGETLE